MDTKTYDELVTLDPYDLSWPGRYRRERDRLTQALGDTAIALEHFGSSAVPGLASKPIVDILVGTATHDEMAAVAEAVGALGYAAHDVGDSRRVYATRRDGEHAFNLAICRFGGAVWCDNLLLRDHLRTDAAARESYEAAKRDALASGHDRLVAYSRAKADVVEALLERARQRIEPRAAAFGVLFGGLDRHGPGSDAATRKALELCRLVPTTSGAFETLDLDAVDRTLHVADLGCGTGASSLVLAGTLDERILAVDSSLAALCELEARAAAAGLDDTIETHLGDIAKLDTDRQFELIWAEGSAYAIGFDDAIRSWGSRLVDGGTLAVTECCWTTKSPPPEAVAFWQQAYPAMRTVDEVVLALRESGLALLGHFTLGEDAWRSYYAPLRKRVAALLDGTHAAPALRAAATAVAEEIALWDAHGAAWDYEFFVLRRA